jgi:hypothetical protein
MRSFAIGRTAFAAAVGGATLGAAAGFAAEVIGYGYDARGRLARVERSGAVNNGIVTNYQYDDADNRTGKTTTGSPNPPPP